MLDHSALAAAHAAVVADLVAERDNSGHWIGELSASALSTATAISALSILTKHASREEIEHAVGTSVAAIDELIRRGVHWLAANQNKDGGWGDTDRSHSNIATTMLVRAALHLSGEASNHAAPLARAEQYIRAQGDIDGLRRRYGRDKTFAVPILANCALAGLVPWQTVSALPFELAVFPQAWYRFLGLPVVSYAIPALVAIGYARYIHAPPRNPIARLARRATAARALRVLEKAQPKSGGFLEATPLTSFVAMSLAASGQAHHAVVLRGAKFLVESVRPDGSWPIDTNLATWNTTLSINALASPRGTIASPAENALADPRLLDWLLACQHRVVHPYTGAAPGGWAWTDLSGGVPDVDDTSGALLALAALRDNADDATRRRIDEAAVAGVTWLLDLQNRDGGWPTFCRGWGKLPFDRSGSDLTAHALRAIAVWSPWLTKQIKRRTTNAENRAMTFLTKSQRQDGSWTPLWFGNQDHPAEENPVYGTARVLLAFRDLGHENDLAALRGVTFLLNSQNADGGWNGAGHNETEANGLGSTVEETALAIEAILTSDDEKSRQSAERGLDWLARAVAENRHKAPSPIGFYFARLWYYERLYPLTFTASALGQAVARLRPRPRETPELTPPM